MWNNAAHLFSFYSNGYENNMCLFASQPTKSPKTIYEITSVLDNIYHLFVLFIKIIHFIVVLRIMLRVMFLFHQYKVRVKTMCIISLGSLSVKIKRQ